MFENHEFLEDQKASILLKNTFFQFFSTNNNLFINAYIKRDFNELHKSFYTVSVAITTIDIFNSYLKPFWKYYLDLMDLKAHFCCVFGSFYEYKEKRRDRMRA